MSNGTSSIDAASLHDLITEISPFLSLNKIIPEEPRVKYFMDDEFSNILDPTNNPGEQISKIDSNIGAEITVDNAYNASNCLYDIATYNTVEKTENVQYVYHRNAFWNDSACDENQNDRSSPNEGHNNDNALKTMQSPGRIKCIDINCNTNIQGIHLPQNLSIQEAYKTSDHADTCCETENYEGKQLCEKTYLAIEESHYKKEDQDHNVNEVDVQSYEEQIPHKVQEVENYAQSNVDMLNPSIAQTCCPRATDLKIKGVIQSCQAIKAEPLMDKKGGPPYLSSEAPNNCLDSSNTKDIHTDTNDFLGLKGKNVEIISESPSFQHNENLQKAKDRITEVLSPAEPSIPNEFPTLENGFNDTLYYEKFKGKSKILIKPADECNEHPAKLLNKSLLYSGEIAKIPYDVINKTISAFHLESSKQLKQEYAPSGVLCHKSMEFKCVRPPQSGSNTSIVAPIFPITQVNQKNVSLNTLSSDSSLQKETTKHVPTILRGKKEKQRIVKAVLLKSILPPGMKMFTKRVSISGLSPAASSTIYSIAGTHPLKTQMLGSNLSSTKQINAKNTTSKNSAIPFSSAPDTLVPETPVTSGMMTTLPPVSSSTPSEFTDTFQMPTTPSLEQSASANIVTLLQKPNSLATSNEPKNLEACHADISNTISSTDAMVSNSSVGSLCPPNKPIYQQSCTTDSSKVDSHQNVNITSTEDATDCSICVDEIITAHNKTTFKLEKVQGRRQGRISKGTKEKEKDKGENEISVVKSITFVPPMKRNRNILPKYGNETEIISKKLRESNVSIITESQKVHGKIAKISRSKRTCIQRKKKTVRNNNSTSSDCSMSQSNMLNKNMSPLSTDRCISKSVIIAENNTPMQDFTGKREYFGTVSEGFTYNKHSATPLGFDKMLQETPLLSCKIDDVDNNSFNVRLPTNISDHYPAFPKNKYPQLCDTISSCELSDLSMEYDSAGKLCDYSASFDATSSKEFSADNYGKSSSNINQEKCKEQDNVFICNDSECQVFPNSVSYNPSLSNKDTNIYPKYNTFDNYSIECNNDMTKRVQGNYFNEQEDGHHWYDAPESQQQKVLPRHLNVYEGNGPSGRNKANEHFNNIGNHCKKSTGTSEQINNWNGTGEQNNNFSLYERNIKDTVLPEPGIPIQHPRMPAFFNYSKHFIENLHGIASVKNVQSLQNSFMERNDQKEMNMKSYMHERTGKINAQYLEEGPKRKRKRAIGSSKSSLKLQNDKPYTCYLCGKSEQYNVILQRHMQLEHGFTTVLPTQI